MQKTESPMTDTQILEHAKKLWQRKEGMEFTMERLTEATGLSRATLYRRFGSREAILQQLVEQQAIDAAEVARVDMPARIMQATRVTLNRTGFAGITIEQIAQEAGVGAATIYRHFGSKEALLEAFIQDNTPRHLIRSLEANHQSDMEADLLLIVSTLLRFIHDNRGLIQVFLFDSASGEVYLERVRATQGRTINILANYLAGHITLGNLCPADPFTLALTLIGACLGVGLIGPHSYDRPLTDINATARTVVQTFLHGVAQQPESHL